MKCLQAHSHSTHLPLDPPFILVANEAYQLYCFAHSPAMESANALSKQQNCSLREIFIEFMSNTIHSRPELAVNGGVVASFACSCSLNCFAFSHRIRPPIGMLICTNQSSTNPVEFFTRGGGAMM